MPNEGGLIEVLVSSLSVRADRGASRDVSHSRVAVPVSSSRRIRPSLRASIVAMPPIVEGSRLELARCGARIDRIVDNTARSNKTAPMTVNTISETTSLCCCTDMVPIIVLVEGFMRYCWAICAMTASVTRWLELSKVPVSRKALGLSCEDQRSSCQKLST